jgi:hypothetical protein
MTTAEAREKLTQHGLSPDQAAGVVDVLEVWVQERAVTRDYLDARLAELKADLRKELGEVRKEMGELKADVRKDMGDLKADVHDSLRGLAIQFYGGVAFMLFVATIVNHYWK